MITGAALIILKLEVSELVKLSSTLVHQSLLFHLYISCSGSSWCREREFVSLIWQLGGGFSSSLVKEMRGQKLDFP